jgi:hypothetical protein
MPLISPWIGRRAPFLLRGLGAGMAMAVRSSSIDRFNPVRVGQLCHADFRLGPEPSVMATQQFSRFAHHSTILPFAMNWRPRC